MKKRATLLHGTNGSPDDHWFPWINQVLQHNGYEVFAPELPDNHRPNFKTYEKFLKNASWDFNDNLMIGHSSGTTTILNLLMTDWFPKVKASVLVGTFLNEKLTKEQDWHEEGQFKNLFIQHFDIDKLRDKCSEFIFVHGDNDPYCDYDDARDFSKELKGEFITVSNGGHLSGSSGITEIPEITKKLEEKNIL